MPGLIQAFFLAILKNDLKWQSQT